MGGMKKMLDKNYLEKFEERIFIYSRKGNEKIHTLLFIGAIEYAVKIVIKI